VPVTVMVPYVVKFGIQIGFNWIAAETLSPKGNNKRGTVRA
jgi:hypothetical protein